MMLSVRWHGVHTLLYSRMEEFFEFVIVVVVVVGVIVVNVEKISELVLVVIVGIVMAVKTVKKSSRFVFVMIVMTVKTVKRSSKVGFMMIGFVVTVTTWKNSEFVIVEVRHKFIPRSTDVLESAVKVYGCMSLRVHEALPDHVRRLQELGVCHESIQLIVVSAKHRDVRVAEEGEKLGVRMWGVHGGSMAEGRVGMVKGGSGRVFKGRRSGSMLKGRGGSMVKRRRRHEFRGRGFRRRHEGKKTAPAIGGKLGVRVV
jgi:hypothetical protein